MLTFPTTYVQYSSSTASTVLSAIVGAAAALTGNFVVTVAMSIVQMVNEMFSRATRRLWYRRPRLKATLALLAGPDFSFAMLRRIELHFVPNAGVSASGALIVAGSIMFLFFFS